MKSIGARAERLNESTDRIAIVVGSFDPIHAGSMSMLSQAEKYGKIYILLHSDDYIRANKGTVVASWAVREKWLRQLSCVADVLAFDDRRNDAVNGLKLLRRRFPGAELTLVSGTSPTVDADKTFCQTARIAVVQGLAWEWQFSVAHQRPTEMKPEKVHVVCLKWGDKFGADYVNKLYAGVRRNTRRTDIEFHCFTDDASGLQSGIRAHDLPVKNLSSWWNKLYLFSDKMDSIPIGEKIFYIDLDTLITGNIDDLLSVAPKRLVVLEDFYKGMAKSANEIGSGLMAWYHGDYSYLWDDFIVDPDVAVKQMHPYGDQFWIQQKVKERQCWQQLFPRQVVSYKVHCRDGLARNARIVCYHGKPSIPESITEFTKDWKWRIKPAQWVNQYWKE